jgi:hypothetical protein
MSPLSSSAAYAEPTLLLGASVKPTFLLGKRGFALQNRLKTFYSNE